MKYRFLNIVLASVLLGLFSINGLVSQEAAPAQDTSAESGKDSYSTLGIRQYEKLLPESQAFTRLPVNWKALDHDKENARKAWQMILEDRAGQPGSERKLHVVYVTFSDRPALEKVQERYDHMLKNIQAYYADQMKENGFPPLTFALDLDENGQLIIHEAHVDKPMKEMTVQSSGPVSRAAAKKVLAAKGIDIENNHALVICQLEDGIGPYYGGGYYKNGTGWTCDQAGLDPRNFLSKEYFGGRYKQTVGGNATIYIGGTAHELGHAFGLPHTMESWLYPNSGRSLMGSGNHTYGQDLRNESKGSYLAPTDALMLAAVPLFNGMETKATTYTIPDVEYSDVTFEPVPHGAVIRGTIHSKVRSHAIVVHLDPPGGSDYDAITVGAVPDKDGKFTLEIRRPDYSGPIDMRVTALFTDGTRNIQRASATVSEKGLESPAFIQSAYFSKVLDSWADGKYADARKALEEVKTKSGEIPAVKMAIPMWERVLSGKTPELKFSPATTPQNLSEISLADCQYKQGKSGWGGIKRNVLFESELGPLPKFQDGGEIDRFLLVHANGMLKFDLAGKWDHFKAQVGVPKGRYGTVKFEVLVDGKSLFTSKVLEYGQSVNVDVPVKGGRELEIRVTDGGDGIGSDWGVIGNPVLTRTQQ